MHMCVLQYRQTYGGVGNSVCYEWQEPDGMAQVEGQKARPSIEGEARYKSRAKPEIKLGRGSRWARSPEKFWKFKLEIVQFGAIKIKF